VTRDELIVVLDAAWSADVSTREGVRGSLTALDRLTAWCDAQRLACVRALESLSTAPEFEIADASRSSIRDAEKVVERARAADAAPVFADALADGSISRGHLDALSLGLRQLEPADRHGLAQQASRLLLIAQNSTPEDFAKSVRSEVRRLQRDDGMSRFDQQRRNSRLRTWTEKDSGMWCVYGRFDPMSGVKIDAALRALLDAKYAEKAPPDAPSDPKEKQDFLRAHAFVALVEGGGVRLSPPELTVVVDTRTSGPPAVDWGIPVELPVHVLSDLFGRVDAQAVVVRGGAVLHAPGELNLGRASRLANRAQRRALRAIYAVCAIAGCHEKFHNCQIHHIEWFEHGGRTDLANLVPLCSRHHHCVHDGGWKLTITDERVLTASLPDGTVMCTGPPSRFAA
jgi:hypothetical protein